MDNMFFQKMELSVSSDFLKKYNFIDFTLQHLNSINNIIEYVNSKIGDNATGRLLACRTIDCDNCPFNIRNNSKNVVCGYEGSAISSDIVYFSTAEEPYELLELLNNIANEYSGKKIEFWRVK